MIVTPDYCQLMARYNLWQNQNLVAAAEALSPAARAEERGAFFGSIAGTFSHLLWADLAWMSRFEAGEAPACGVTGSAALFADWEAFKAQRAETDARILAWAQALGVAELASDLAWYSGTLGRDVTRALGLCVAHFFNHQTHHRGQIHAMLTAAGARPGDTDLFVMPEDVGR